MVVTGTAWHKPTYSQTPRTTSPVPSSPPSRVVDRLVDAEAYFAEKTGRPLTEAERKELLSAWEQDQRRECGVCNGLGWLRLEDGQLAACESCSGPEPLNRRLVVAGFLPGEVPPLLHAYRPDRQPKGPPQSQAKAALNAVVKWAKGEAAPTLMLLGQTGVGKTHLAAGSVHELCNRRQDAVMATGSGFTAYMRQFEDGTADWYRRRTRTCGWLAIDDIGAAGHDPSGYLLSEYEALIDERYRMARPTLVTTNLSEGDLRAVIGERAVSRLYDTTRSVQVVMKDCVDLRRVSA